MITYVLLRVFVVFLLVALNAFFVAAEFALVSVRDTRIQQLIEQRPQQHQGGHGTRILPSTRRGALASFFVRRHAERRKRACCHGAALSLLPFQASRGLKPRKPGRPSPSR